MNVCATEFGNSELYHLIWIGCVMNVTGGLLGETPLAVRMAVGAVFWVLSVLILIYHRSGAQVVGMVIVLIGSLGLITGANPHIALFLVLCGFICHSLGRVMHWMRRR